MTKRISKTVAWMLALTMFLAMAVTSPVYVSAAEAPSMEVQFEKDWYPADEIITARVFIKNATFNAAGLSLKYDTDIMTVVSEDGTEGDKPGLIRIENKYDKNENTGYFVTLGRTVDSAAGTLKALFYVKERVGGNTVTADSEGILAASVSFKMKTDAKPELQFAAVSGDADFSNHTFLILNAGVQDENATASVVYLEEGAQEDPFVLPYTDVPETEWYYPYVKDVYLKGLMTGLNDTTFEPTQNLSRAQFAVILYRMEDTPEVTYEALYPDVPEGQWFTDAVIWASKNGIITGYTYNGCFGPADDITREQMATMLYRYAAYKEYDTDTLADLSGYPDSMQVSEFAERGMRWCVANEIISGDGITGNLMPQGKTVRAVCATVISRFTDAF